jgi:hypothetical protein
MSDRVGNPRKGIPQEGCANRRADTATLSGQSKHTRDTELVRQFRCALGRFHYPVTWGNLQDHS